MLLLAAITAYLEDLRERQLTTAHIKTVSYRLNRFAKTRPKNQKIEKLTRADLTEFFVKLREGISDGSMAGYTSTHRAFWSFCKREGFTKKNLGKALKKKYSYKPVVRKAAPPDSLAAVLAALHAFAWHRGGRPRDVRDAALVSLSIDAGARRGAMWGLRRSHVERALRQGVRASNGRTVYSVESYTNKTGTETITFCQETADYLLLYLERAPYTRYDLLFYSLSTGEPMKRGSLSRAFDRVCKFAGVPTFRSQSVRKINGSRLINDYHDLNAAQQYLGHSDPNVTLVHYNDAAAAKTEATARLADDRRGVNDALIKEFFKKKE